MDIYVGNLPYSATEEEVAEAFAAFGPVERVKMITDRETGKPRGFAFVTLADSSKVAEAAEAMDGSDFGGRSLRVNPAEPRAPRSGGPGGDRRGGGGGGERRGGGGYQGGGDDFGERRGGGGYDDRRGGGRGRGGRDRRQGGKRDTGW